MTGRTMDLRPPAVRQRVAHARERSRLVQLSLLAATCLSMAWSAAAWRLREARSDHELAVTRADEVLRVERELAEITERFDRAGRRLEVWRRCSIPFGPSSILASIANDRLDRQRSPQSPTIASIGNVLNPITRPRFRPARPRRHAPHPRRRVRSSRAQMARHGPPRPRHDVRDEAGRSLSAGFHAG